MKNLFEHKRAKKKKNGNPDLFKKHNAKNFVFFEKKGIRGGGEETTWFFFVALFHLPMNFF